MPIGILCESKYGEALVAATAKAVTKPDSAFAARNRTNTSGSPGA